MCETYTILLADDREERRHGLLKMLEGGFVCLEAADAESAKAALSGTLHVDVLVVDLSMRRAEGYALLEQVRRDSAFAALKILALTTEGGENLAQALALGATDAASYPLYEAELRARIHRMLQCTEQEPKAIAAREDYQPDMDADLGASAARLRMSCQKWVTWASPAFFALRGAERDLTPTVMTRLTQETMYPEDEQRLRQELHDARKAGKDSWSTWYRIKRLDDGEMRSIIGNFRWQDREDGMHMVLSEVDCTSLTERWGALYTLSERMPGAVMIFRLDEQLTTLYTSSALWRKLGYAETGPSGSGMELLSVDSHLRLKQAASRCPDGEEISLDVQLYNSAGRLVSFILQGKHNVYNKRGAALMYAVLWDLRDAPDAMARTMAAERADRETLRFLRMVASTLLPAVGLTLWRYDVARGHLWPVSCEIPQLWQIALRDTPESLIRCGLVLPDTAEACREMFSQLQSGTRRVSRILHMQLHEGQRPCWLSFNFLRYDNAPDGGRVMAGISQDVTEQIEAMASFRQERRYREALLQDAMLCFEVDLTSGTVRQGDADFMARLRLRDTADFRELVEGMAQQVVRHPGPQEFLRRVSPETLQSAFRRGEHLLQQDMEMCMPGEQESTWVTSLMNLVEDERTGHLHMTWQLKNATASKREELQLRDAAKRDSLTGLYNRANFETMVQESLRQNRQGEVETAVFMLDVDNFKHINDTYGHDQGDAILREIGQRLQKVFRATDAVARLGGDEFAVLIPQSHSRERIRERGAQVVASIGQMQPPVTVSVGLAFAPEGGDTFEKLYHSADQALYHAKRMGKNCLWVWGDKGDEAHEDPVGHGI